MNLDGVVLITTCTNRKRRPVPPALQACSLEEGPQESVLHEWCDRLSASPSIGLASDIYCGRSFREAYNAAREISGSLWIISTGLGLVPENETIPAYSITLGDAGPDSIVKKIKGTFSPSRWWTGITSFNGSPDPIHHLIIKNPSKLFVFALSRAYAHMVQQDIMSLSDDQLERVRLIGLALKPVLDSRLQQIVMPYDERLDGPDSRNTGTRSDFAQRAMRHFVNQILKSCTLNSHKHHACLVEERLAGQGHRKIPKRKRLSDQEIIDVILRHLNSSGVTSSKMLRIIRDDEQIACEQGRFKELYRLAREKVSS